MSRPTILNIEDDSNDVVLLEHAFRQAGLLVHLQTVTDGEQAVAYLRGTGKFADREQFPLPQLVLLDLKVPRLSGFDVLRWIRSEEQFRRLPVVVLSACSHEADIQRCYELGANSYLFKPVGFEPLVELVKTLHHYWFE